MKKILIVLLTILLVMACVGCGQIVTTNTEQTFSEKIRALEINDVFEFGNYEQDGNEENGKEPVEWSVIAKEHDKVLVISNKVLDLKEYYYGYPENVTWENSSLRKWLNSDFLNNCFTEDEQNKIPLTFVTGETTFKSGDDSPTQDKVFILSYSEANQYLTSDSLKISELSQYAESKKEDYYIYKAKVGYYLRTLGAYNDRRRVCSVNANGEFDGYKIYHNCELGYGIRPAIWIEAVD